MDYRCARLAVARAGGGGNDRLVSLEGCRTVSMTDMNDDAPVGAVTLRRMVHDLRAPLNAMRLSLDLLRRTLDRDDLGSEEFREEQTRQLERIGRQVTAMNDLLARVVEGVAARHEEASN